MPDPGLVLLAQIDPFETSELRAFMTWLGRESGIPIDTPLLIDLWRRRLAQGSTEQMCSYTVWRRSKPCLPTGPVAVLVLKEADYGLVRVWQQHIALRGLRDESDVIVTLNPMEAAGWLISRSARPDADPQGVLAALEQLP